MTPGGKRLGAGERTYRPRLGGKGLGGNCLGGLVWVWVGLAWAQYFVLSLPTAAAAAAAGEAPVARAGTVLRFRGVLGVAAWLAKAVARPAGTAVATRRAPSSLSPAAVAAASEAPVARAGSVSRFRGVLGVAAWPAKAVARPAGAAVATPRAPSSLSSAAVAAASEAPVAGAGSVPRFRSVLGVAAWPAEAVAPPAGAAVATPRASSSLSSAATAALGDAPGSCAGGRGRGRGVARWGCGPRFLRVWGPLPGRGGRACCLGGWGGHLGWLRLPGRWRRPDQHCRLRQPPLLALREGLPRPLRGGGGVGAGPAVVAVVPLGGAIGVCHHCYPGRHAWWQARPSHYFLVHQCPAVGSAVRCSAGGRGGGGRGPAVASAPHGRGPAAIHQHWEGRRGSHAAHASRHSSESGAGRRALGPREWSGGVGGSRTRWTPVTAVTSCVRRKVCTPSRAAGAGRGGGVRVLPHRGGWG